MSKLFTKNHRLIFLIALSIAGSGLLYLATSKYGGGVAGDSISYLSVAQNLLRGKGFVDYTGAPLILFPPLLPTMIAGLAWIFKADVFIVGWLLNVILWGLNLFLSGIVLGKIFADRPVYFYISMLILFTSVSLLKLHGSVLTDPLFLTITLLFFLASGSYINTRSWQSLAWMAALATLAPLLRFSGLAHIVAGGLIIFYANIRNWIKSVSLAGLFGVISLIPITLWIYLHNYLPYGTLWGTSNMAGADLQANILQSFRKIMFVFIPDRSIFSAGSWIPFIIFGAILASLIMVNKIQNWQDWGRQLLRPGLLAMLIWTFVYYVSSVLNIQTDDHVSLFSDRYFVILLIPVLALIFTAFDDLIRPHIHLRAEIIQVGMVVLFMVWLIYPVINIYKYVQRSLANGENGYNRYNLRSFQESEMLHNLQALLQKEPDANLYSNIPPAVWLFTRHSMIFPPVQDKLLTKDQIKLAIAGWPNDKPGYYIWFDQDPFKLAMPLSDIYLVADMAVVRKLSDGSIVRVWARGRK